MPLAHEEVAPGPGILRSLVDQLPAMVAYWDANQRCRFANHAYKKWFGVDAESMIGRDMREFLGPLYPLNRPYIEAALRGEAQEFEREIPDPAGGAPRYSQAHYIPDIVDGRVLGFGVLVVDITRRKQAEHSLRQLTLQVQATERLAAMATLATGIAHEINNPLASVLANIELVLEASSGNSAATDAAAANRSALLEALAGVNRIAEIVRSMKLLARGDSQQPSLLDIDDVVEQSISLASNTFKYQGRLVRELTRPGQVFANPSQLAQVFVNLLVNAAQALPDEPRGDNEIRVSTRREQEMIIVEVADNGEGIAPELQSQIFEPFYTTKGVGLGSGLGLPIANSIVSTLGGKISLTSEARGGSSFRVALPWVQAARLAKPTPAPAPSARPPVEPSSNHRPRLLVVDDEPAVAQVLDRILSRDYDVVVASHGREAIARICGSGEPPFDLILCDLMMPELTGADVHSEVSQHCPKFERRFVFMTGGAVTPSARRFLENVGLPILDKPFKVAAVRTLVAAQIANTS